MWEAYGTRRSRCVRAITFEGFQALTLSGRLRISQPAQSTLVVS
jgi:hypothetical protein